MLNIALRTHRALGDETRLRILAVLAQAGELCVCDVEAALEITQSKASRHLNTLRSVGLVTDRRRGAWVYYRVADLGGYQQAVVETLLAEAANAPQLAADARRAVAARRSPGCG